VRIKLAGDPVVKGGAISVDVKQGVVTLSGQVATSKQRDRAGRVAKKVRGVKQVVNNLSVK
jgi:hyperosmotically inducible protein